MLRDKPTDKYPIGQKVVLIVGWAKGQMGWIQNARVWVQPRGHTESDWFYVVEFPNLSGGGVSGQDKWWYAKEPVLKPIDDEKDDGLGNTDSNKPSNWESFTKATGYIMPVEVLRETI